MTPMNYAWLAAGWAMAGCIEAQPEGREDPGKRHIFLLWARECTDLHINCEKDFVKTEELHIFQVRQP